MVSKNKNEFSWHDVIEIDSSVSEPLRSEIEKSLDRIASDKDGLKKLKLAQQNQAEFDNGNKLVIKTDYFQPTAYFNKDTYKLFNSSNESPISNFINISTGNDDEYIINMHGHR